MLELFDEKKIKKSVRKNSLDIISMSHGKYIRK